MRKIKISINGKIYNVDTLLRGCRVYRMIDEKGEQRGEHNVGYEKYVIYLSHVYHFDEDTAVQLASELYAIQDWIDKHNDDEPPAEVFESLLSCEFVDKKEHEQPSGKHMGSYTPRCPICGSPNIKVIGTGSRLLHQSVFGLASSKSLAQRECRNCRYRF